MESTLPNNTRDPHLWKQAKERVAFKMHLRVYLIANSGMWLIWALISLAAQSGGYVGWLFPWPLFAMLGWGIGLASHYFAVYRGRRERNMIEEEYQKLLANG